MSSKHCGPQSAAAVLFFVASAFGVAGCSQGSGGSFAGSATTAQPASVAQGADTAVSMSFTAIELGGKVEALGAVGSASVLVGREDEVLRVTPGEAPAAELVLQGVPTSFAAIGDRLYMGVEAPGGGALLVREAFGGQTSWRRVYQATGPRVSVASVGSVAVVLSGDGQRGGAVLSLDATNTTSLMASFPLTQPRAAAAFAGALFVAGEAQEGGAPTARVSRLELGQVAQTLQLPMHATHTGIVEQQVIGLGVLEGDPSDALVVVVAERDGLTGADFGGYAAITDGLQATIVAEFDKAPTAAAFLRGSPFVGLADGRVLTLASGTWRELGGLPATLGIERLLPVGDALWIAAKGPQGSRLFAPAPEAAAPAPGASLTFADVRQTLIDSCGACHASPDRRWQVDVDPAADFASIQRFVDTQDPAGSVLLGKGTGAVQHRGGAIWAADDPEAKQVLLWIEQGALPGAAGSTPPTQTPPTQTPPTQTPPTQALTFDAVRQTLIDSCGGCHDSARRSWRIEVDLAADYASTLAVVDTQSPLDSLLLAKGLGTVNHRGGAIWAPDAPEALQVIRWIQGGALAPAQQPPATQPPATQPPAQQPPAQQPATVTFVQDVAPLLAAAGCARCHTQTSQRPFMLSDAGSDVDFDYRALVPYVDRFVPGQSELLLRAAKDLPHPVERISNPSAERDLLLRWIRGGMQRGQ